MQKITFTAKYQGKRSQFEIAPVSGGNGAWYLYVDNYYKGQFSHQGGRWVFLPQDRAAFTPEQVAILEGELNRAHPL